MASPRRQEALIDQISVRQGVSIRRCCTELKFRRQTYYSRKNGHRPEELELEIAGLLHQITKRFVSWGFWMVFHYLRKQGYPWNHKRVYRIWKQEALNLRIIPKRPKLRRKYQGLLSPDQINEGWAVDFLSDWLIGPNEESVRIINVVDECSRKALWTEAHTSISATTLCETLDQLVAWRGVPSYIRCDNGPEFISNKLRDWSEKNEVKIQFIQPGKPTQNGIIERLNGTLRRECLQLHWFKSLGLLNEQLQQWWQEYNFLRPHSSIGYLTPEEFEQNNKKLYFRLVA